MSIAISSPSLFVFFPVFNVEHDSWVAKYMCSVSVFVELHLILYAYHINYS